MPNLDITDSRKPLGHTVHESADGIRISPGPYIGTVKANVDRKRSGRVQVYIPELGGDPADDAAWKTVDYLSPFYTVTPPFDSRNTDPQSSGLWFASPDVGVSVMCIFVNGDPSRGYWIGCVPDWPSMHMMPGISHDIADGTDPLKEWNDKDQSPDAYTDFYQKAQTPLDYQQKAYQTQGIDQDKHRNPGTSTAFRESPSRVFGISTPGPPMDRDPVIEPYDDKHGTLKIYYPERMGGHTFVMDDGNIDGENRRLRLRSTAGHMMLMHDEVDKEFIYIMNHNGKAWVEIDKEGDVYVYSQRDIKITAMRDMFVEVGRSFRLKADTIDIESRQYIRSESNQITSLSHENTKITAEAGLHLKGGEVWLNSDDMINIYGHGVVIIVGALVLINSGGEQDAEIAPPAKLPIYMPRHEPWPYHLDNGGGPADYSFNPNEGFEGASGSSTSISVNPYSAQNNFGGGLVDYNKLVQQMYDALNGSGNSTVSSSGAGNGIGANLYYKMNQVTGVPTTVYDSNMFLNNQYVVGSTNNQGTNPPSGTGIAGTGAIIGTGTGTITVV
jgi:hypothetical protein